MSTTVVVIVSVVETIEAAPLVAELFCSCCCEVEDTRVDDACVSEADTVVVESEAGGDEDTEEVGESGAVDSAVESEETSADERDVSDDRGLERSVGETTAKTSEPQYTMDASVGSERNSWSVNAGERESIRAARWAKEGAATHSRRPLGIERCQSG